MGLVCHHKRESGFSARYWQYTLQELSGKRTLIEAYDLVNLYSLFTIVAESLETLVVLLTRGILSCHWRGGDVILSKNFVASEPFLDTYDLVNLYSLFAIVAESLETLVVH